MEEKSTGTKKKACSFYHYNKKTSSSNCEKKLYWIHSSVQWTNYKQHTRRLKYKQKCLVTKKKREVNFSIDLPTAFSDPIRSFQAAKKHYKQFS